MIRTCEGTFLSCSMILGAPVFTIHCISELILKTYLYALKAY